MGMEDVVRIASTRERFLKSPKSKSSKAAHRKVVRDVFQLSIVETGEELEIDNSIPDPPSTYANLYSLNNIDKNLSRFGYFSKDA
jgi:hypothetical protein